MRTHHWARTGTEAVRHHRRTEATAHVGMSKGPHGKARTIRHWRPRPVQHRSVVRLPHPHRRRPRTKSWSHVHWRHTRSGRRHRAGPRVRSRQWRSIAHQRRPSSLGSGKPAGQGWPTARLCLLRTGRLDILTRKDAKVDIGRHWRKGTAQG